MPIKPMAMALSEQSFLELAMRSLTLLKLPNLTKGKVKRLMMKIQLVMMEPTVGEAQVMKGMLHYSYSFVPFADLSSTRSRRRALARRRRQERAWVQSQLKAPGRHRPDCACAACTSEQISPPCWSCGAARRPMPPRRGFPPPGAGPVIIRNGYPHPHAPGPRNRERERERRRNSRNNVVVVEEPVIEERMSQEDLRTWSLAYTLSIDVYVCADRYLMQDFKRCISNFVINR